MPRINLTLDTPFQEVLREGWGMAKPAGALVFAEQVQETTGSGTLTKLKASGIPEGFWKVPGLGVIALEPRFLQEGMVLYSDTASLAFPSPEIANNDDGSSGLRLLEKAGTFARTRPGKENALIGLLANTAILAVLYTANTQLTPIWRTNSALAANEGFGTLCQPVRVFDDPSTRGYMAWNFGQRFCLALDLQGIGRFYENTGTDEEPDWKVRKVMDLASVGVSLRELFTIQVIPIAGRYIIFRFGNVRFRGRGLRLHTYVETDDFVFDAVREGIAPYWDAGLNQYVVIPPDRLMISVNTSGTDYRFFPLRLRYRTEPVTGRFTGEPMPYALPGKTPVLNAYGFASGFDNGGAGSLTLAYTKEDGGAWVDTEKVICPTITMAASSDGLYTPELWYVEGRCEPVVFEPPYTPYDASEQWTYIRFQRTVEPKAAECTVKFNDESRYNSLFRRGGPFEIQIDGTPRFSGYFRGRRPTVGISTVESEYLGRDMWHRLESRPCGEFESLDGKLVSLVIERLLKRAGFSAAQIQIENSDLQGLTIEGFDDPQSLKVYNPGTMIAEAIRDLIDKYSIQGVDKIRVRWDTDRWRVYLAPDLYDYDDTATDDNHKTFCAVNEARPPGDDAARWVEGSFLITSALEFDIQNPEFNALKAVAASAGGQSDSSLKTIVKPRPEVYEDPTSQLFEGGIVGKEIGPPTITATTQEQLDKQARFYYDREQRKTIGLSFEAEWQPSIDVEDEVIVIGTNPITGQIVSYGVWRIESLDVEVTLDNYNEDPEAEEPPPDRRRDWSWSGSYRLRWLRATKETYAYPMFSEFLPPKRFLT